MKVVTILLALASAFALADGNAVVAPRPATSSKPPASTLGTESITIPQMLSYQGKLTDTLGVPVSDGSYPMVFMLYTAPSGGSSFWSESQDVTVKDGLFSVLLGSVTPIDSVPSAGAAYLGMTVSGGPELTPRIRIASSAFAYISSRAANADRLQGKDTTALDARYVNEGQASSVTSNMIVDGTIAGADLGQMGASTGQVMKWTGSGWAPRNDSVGSGGGSGTVRKVVQSTGVVCSPNPISDSGTVRFDSSYGDSRYIKNQFAANQFASWRIAGQGSCSANSAGGAALKGTNASPTGYGVWGNSGEYYGVYGSSVSGYGVYGTANTSVGVYGVSSSSHGVAGNSVSGYGVYGGSSGSCGVYGASLDSCGIAGTSVVRHTLLYIWLSCA